MVATPLPSVKLASMMASCSRLVPGMGRELPLQSRGSVEKQMMESLVGDTDQSDMHIRDSADSELYPESQYPESQPHTQQRALVTQAEVHPVANNSLQFAFKYTARKATMYPGPMPCTCCG
jgi:hypothetical protein